MIYFIAGPTCSGKTKIGLKLAEKIGGEIISADSRQIYKYLDVGTAKPAGSWKKENDIKTYFVDGIPYHLVDFLEPEKRFSAGDFVSRTGKLTEQINKKGKIPIILGGTGLYIDSFISGLAELPGCDQRLRHKLYRMKEKYGKGYLHKVLSRVDRVSAEKIHPNNTQRLIRALEIYYLTGKPISAWHSKQKETVSDEKHALFALDYAREILYERINKRVDMMLRDGMIQETTGLLNLLKKRAACNTDCPALQSLGYSHIIEFLNKKIPFEIMEERIKKDTRNYAKRQLTWFRRNKDIKWIDAEINFPDKIVDLIIKMSSS